MPPRVEYALTSLGSGLIDIVKQLIGWATDHHGEIHANRVHSGTTAASASRF